MFEIPKILQRRQIPQRKQLHELKPREMELLTHDVDVVWLNEDAPSGDPQIFHELANASPEEAAQAFRMRLAETDATGLADRLDTLGVACGTLRKNKGIPSGVYAMLRSGSPMLLVSEVAPPDYDRAAEIAREMGVLIYGQQSELVDEFAENLRGSFVQVEGSLDSTALTRVRRALGSATTRSA